MKFILSVKMASASSNIVLALCSILVFYGKEASTEDVGISPAPGGPEDLTFPALLAFGDSILDTGNNNNLFTLSKVNFPPYGRDFPGQYSTGRFGNGKVFSDLIAEGLRIKSQFPAYLDPNLRSEDLATGVCFASGGSGYDELTATMKTAISLTEQLNLFKEYIRKLEEAVGHRKAKATIRNSLYLASAGNNDLAITHFLVLQHLQYDVNTYTTQLVAWASDFIKDLYALGARKFAFQSTLPLGCLPLVRTVAGGLVRNCVNSLNQAAEMFNSKLEAELSNLNSNLPGAKLVFIDVYNPLLHIIKNPKEFGFEDSTCGCCGTGLAEVEIIRNPFSPFTCSNASSHVFWDSAHPSERAYRIIVSDVIHEISRQLLAI